MIIIAGFTFSSEENIERKEICLDVMLTKLADSANIDDCDMLLWKDSTNIKTERLYTLSHRTRTLLQKRKRSSQDEQILIQTTFSSKFSGSTYISKSFDLTEKFLVNEIYSPNFITILNKNIENIEIKYFFSFDNHVYIYLLPYYNLLSALNKHLNYNYEINVDVLSKKESSVLYKEIKLKVSVKKTSLGSSFLKVKLRENICWIPIGKTKYLEKMDHNDTLNLSFSIMPILDGFIGIPDVEFMEHLINSKEEKISNQNHLEFMNLDNALIEGNKIIIKVLPKNNFQMKMNII